MLLIKPRRLVRSRNTSCSTPFSTSAARASWLFALIRISLPIDRASACDAPQRHARRLEQLGGFIQRQTHHRGIAAAQAGDEYGTTPLNGISTRLVARLSGMPIVARLRRR